MRPPERPRTTRFVYFSFGWICVGLGAVGAVLPGIPTTPAKSRAEAATTATTSSSWIRKRESAADTTSSDLSADGRHVRVDHRSGELVFEEPGYTVGCEGANTD